MVGTAGARAGTAAVAASQGPLAAVQEGDGVGLGHVGQKGVKDLLVVGDGVVSVFAGFGPLVVFEPHDGLVKSAMQKEEDQMAGEHLEKRVGCHGVVAPKLAPPGAFDGDLAVGFGELGVVSGGGLGNHEGLLLVDGVLLVDVKVGVCVGIADEGLEGSPAVHLVGIAVGFPIVTLDSQPGLENGGSKGQGRYLAVETDADPVNDVVARVVGREGVVGVVDLAVAVGVHLAEAGVAGVGQVVAGSVEGVADAGVGGPDHERVAGGALDSLRDGREGVFEVVRTRAPRILRGAQSASSQPTNQPSGKRMGEWGKAKPSPRSSRGQSGGREARRRR